MIRYDGVFWNRSKKCILHTVVSTCAGQSDIHRDELWGTNQSKRSRTGDRTIKREGTDIFYLPHLFSLLLYQANWVLNILVSNQNAIPLRDKAAPS
mmetsp:Transcript_17518/g.36479  ORF Transcript_17518/g.36479 Transcript_17518/m.36479 type:complete len:96 (+) Transcript_17518:491-778(+)